MNYLIACILLIISSFLYCCNSNTYKEKELELKQKELELKEHELNLEKKQLEENNKTNTIDEKTPIKKSTNNTSTNFYGEASYIPIEEYSKQTASFILEYSYTKGANRPFIDLQFGEGPDFFLNAVCEGEYNWCIRNEDNQDIAYMKILFENNGETAELLIMRNDLSQEYENYLNLLEGKVHKM